MGGGLEPGTHTVCSLHPKKNQQATCCHFDIFGTLWCGTGTRPDRYERPHCSVSLVILLFNFYHDYRRFALGKLQLSSYGATLLVKRSATDVLELATPIWS